MRKDFLLVCLSLCSADVLAQDNEFYIGLGAGLADVSNSVASNAFVDGLSVIEGARLKISERNRNDVEEKTAFSYHALGGYSVNETLSFEISFHDFGKTEVTQESQKFYRDGSSATGVSDFELSTMTVSFKALLSYPVSQRVSLFGSVGGAWSQQERRMDSARLDALIEDNSVRDLRLAEFSETEENSHFGLTYGVGTSIEINESFESRVRVTGIELENGRIFDYGLSLIYRI